MTIINAVVGWFSLCYSITLYKQVAKGNEKLPGKNLLPLVIISVIGGIIGLFLVVTLIKYSPELTYLMAPETGQESRIKSNQENSEMPSSDLEMPTEAEMEHMMENYEQKSDQEESDTI